MIPPLVPLWLTALLLTLGALLAAVGVGALRRSVRLTRLADELLRTGDVATRLRPTGHGPLLALAQTYNRAIDTVRAERVALEERQGLLDRVTEASISGLLTLDFDGRISTLNPAAARTLGAERAALLGLPLAAVGTPLAAAMAVLPPHAQAVVPLGPRRLRLTRGAFVDRGFERAFYTIEELTDDLRRSEKAAYEKVIRLLAHEVNNSVGAIASLLRSTRPALAHAPDDTRTDAQDALDLAARRAEHLAAFLRPFADVARLPPPVPVPTALGPLLHDVARLMTPAAAPRRIRLHVDAAPAPDVRVDPFQIEQVLVNIVKNALEAVEADGDVWLRLRPAPGRVTVEVADSGPGPSADAQAHLFTPFFTTKPDGQGLGLTLIRELLDAHGATYALDHPPGGPTTFHLSFRVEG